MFNYAKMQKNRLYKYPIDRIPFLGNDTAADSDKATFKAYHEGVISLKSACERIAKANYLESVTETQFLNEYHICGYGRYQVQEDEEDSY